MINKEDWEMVRDKTEAMIKDAELTIVNATLMLNHAKEEIKKCPSKMKTSQPQKKHSTTQ